VRAVLRVAAVALPINLPEQTEKPPLIPCSLAARPLLVVLKNREKHDLGCPGLIYAPAVASRLRNTRVCAGNYAAS
jgi:hypothetical protein